MWKLDSGRFGCERDKQGVSGIPDRSRIIDRMWEYGFPGHRIKTIFPPYQPQATIAHVNSESSNTVTLWPEILSPTTPLLRRRAMDLSTGRLSAYPSAIVPILSLPLSNDLDVCMMTGRRRKFSIAGEHWRIERLCESHVNGIIGRQIIAKFPYATEERKVRIPSQGEFGQIDKRIFSARRSDDSLRHLPSQHLRHFHVEQVRRMQLLRFRKNACLHSNPGSRLKQPLDGGRCIEHDQWESRSVRTARAAETVVRPGSRRWRRSRISSSVGRSASFRISASR